MIQYVYNSFVIHCQRHLMCACTLSLFNPLVLVLSLKLLDHKEEDCSHDIRTPSKRNADLEDVRTRPVKNFDRVRVQRKRNRHSNQCYWSCGDPYYRERV
jgi:hypothetical protein